MKNNYTEKFNAEKGDIVKSFIKENPEFFKRRHRICGHCDKSIAEMTMGEWKNHIAHLIFT